MAIELPRQLPMKGLTIGRTAHYVLDNFEHRAAIIVDVIDPVAGIVTLNVQTAGVKDAEWLMDPETAFFIQQKAKPMPEVIRREAVHYSENSLRVATWHWIEPA